MQRLKEALINKKFVITAEIFPPKGIKIEKFLDKGKLLKKYVDAVNLTDNQRAVMRISSLATSKLILDLGIDAVYQLTCRDRNRIALQSDLLGAYSLGVRNVLALSGDFPTNGDHPEAKPVYDLDTVQLIETIKTLNEGYDLSGKKLNGATDFFIGAVCNPVHENMDLQYMMIHKKIKAGAMFFQTQAIYDAKLFEDFIKTINNKNIKFLAGILPLKSAKMARFLNKKVPGIIVPDNIINIMENSNDPLKTGEDIASKLIKDLRSFANGVHIMAINFEEQIPDIINNSL